MAIRPLGPRGFDAGDRNAERLRADMFGFFRDIAAQFGDVVAFDIGRSPCILVNGAAEVRELFLGQSDHLRKPEFLKDSNRAYWGDGLTTLEGAAWKARRRLLRPSFESKAVSARLSIVAECTADMLAAWEPESQIDLLYELRLLTGRIAARTVLDADVERLGSAKGRSGMLTLDEAYGEDYSSHPGGDETAPLVMTRPRAPRDMSNVLRIIDERLAGGAHRGDVLSDLASARDSDGAPLTRGELAGEVIQMLFAGHHTIPSSLAHLVRDVAANDATDRLAAEADALCVSEILSQADLAQSYCVAALKESMRVHPPAPILYREVETPFELSGFEFPRDSAVWVSPMLLHHDNRYFPEPGRFRPERFLDRQPAAWQSVYLPFGAGSRTCIGNHLALHQSALTYLLIARSISLTTSGDDVNRFVVHRRR